jgi:ornithine cyclodeaminase/alanine dehydrogenase-like protein (mu-crystallin family)
VLEVGGRAYFAAKANANFPQNPAKGLATIQGVVLLFDANDGRILAVMESSELTALRTAATTAVAARHLARPESTTMTICGAGKQAHAHVRAFMHVLPISTMYVCDADSSRAQRFAREVATELGVTVGVVKTPADGAAQSDVVVTCTTSREYIIDYSALRAGMFVAGVGVDNENKRELHPDIIADCKVVTDLTEQCAAIGDLHHAIEAGLARASDVHGELAAIVAGVLPGRESAEEIIVYDSTGLAIEDVAAAVAVYQSLT